jgi:hypothetical protein
VLTEIQKAEQLLRAIDAQQEAENYKVLTSTKRPVASEKLSRYFTVGEFTKGGTRPFNSPSQHLKCKYLARALDVIRDYYGGPMVITSGVRSAEVNRAIGGASQSQHVVGCAADVMIFKKGGARVPARQVFADFNKFWADSSVGIGGIGRYSAANNTTHFDLRRYPASWDWSNR